MYGCKGGGCKVEGACVRTKGRARFSLKVLFGKLVYVGMFVCKTKVKKKQGCPRGGVVGPIGA